MRREIWLRQAEELAIVAVVLVNVFTSRRAVDPVAAGGRPVAIIGPLPEAPPNDRQRARCAIRVRDKVR